MLVRDLERGVVTNLEPIGELLEQRGVVEINQIGNATVKLMTTSENVQYRCRRDGKKNPHLMCKFEDE